MTTVYDVPTDLLIKKISFKLKKIDACQPPEWAEYVKTAVHKEKAPREADWWYTREAAILRKVYKLGPIGTNHLCTEFCGPKDRGSKPYRTRSSSGSVVRKALIQLEEAGLVQTVKGKGREVSPKGRSLLDNTSHEVLKEIIKENPELGKY